MALSWSVDGAHVELRFGQLTVKVQGRVKHRTTVGNEGEWPFPVNDLTYRIARVRTFAGVLTELYSHDGGLIPDTKHFVAKVQAPPHSVCGHHADTEARVACARCGTFACDRCLGADLIHCRSCLDRVRTEAKGRPREATYLAPALLFLIVGGLIGAALGLLAGTASLAIAHRVQSRRVRALIALGIYGAAAAFYLATAAFLGEVSNSLHR